MHAGQLVLVLTDVCQSKQREAIRRFENTCVLVSLIHQTTPAPTLLGVAGVDFDVS